MGQLKGETAYFIGQAPEYEVRGDHIVCLRSGMEFVMPVPVVQTIIAKLERAVAKWQIGKLGCDARVTPIGRQRR